MRSFIAAALVVMPALALAEPPGIQVDHAWSRAAPTGATGVVYLTITDQGTADTLIAVSSPVAAKVELHESFDDHSVMKMREVASLPVAPGRQVTLKPGGYHIMLMGLKQALIAGTNFPVTLTFANAGEVATMVTVQKLSSVPKPDHGHGDMEGMPGMRGH